MQPLLIIKTDPSIEPNPGSYTSNKIVFTLVMKRSYLNKLGFVTMALLEHQVIANTLPIVNS